MGFITTSSTMYSTSGGTAFVRPMTTSRKCFASGLGFFRGRIGCHGIIPFAATRGFPRAATISPKYTR